LSRTDIHRGQLIENLAKYGDPSEYELPIGFKYESNADMTFTGMHTSIGQLVINKLFFQLIYSSMMTSKIDRYPCLRDQEKS